MVARGFPFWVCTVALMSCSGADIPTGDGTSDLPGLEVPDDVDVGSICPEGQPSTAEELQTVFATAIHPLLMRTHGNGGCATCHSPGSSHKFVLWDDPIQTMNWLWSQGYLDASVAPSLGTVLWDDAPLQMPMGGPYWSDEEVATVTSFVCDLYVSDVEPGEICDGEIDAGNVILRRLSNYEYDESVRSLTGDLHRYGLDFPADDPAYGFDNLSSAQKFSAGRLEKYQDAAYQIALDTLRIPAPLGIHKEAEDLKAFTVKQVPLEDNPYYGGPDLEKGLYHLKKGRSYVTTGLHSIVFAGTYSVEVRVRGYNADLKTKDCEADDAEWVVEKEDQPAKMRLTVNGITMVKVAIEEENGWEKVSVDVELEPGLVDVRVWLDNVQLWCPNKRLDVQLDVDWIEMDGPAILPPVDTERIAKYMICDPQDPPGSADECAKNTVQNTLGMVWRRPPTDTEVDRYVALMEHVESDDGTFKDGVELVLEAALLSPNFLFRPEEDPNPADPKVHDLDAYELATRLSYFIWSTVPDAELLALAAAGTLNDDAVLSAQIDRLMDHKQAQTIADNFAAQWLHLRQMELMVPSAAEFTQSLKASMIQEVRQLFVAFLEKDLSLLDIVDVDFSVMNEEMTKHYGIDWPKDVPILNVYQEIDTTGLPRGGLLLTAGFLTLTSHPARTSPTKRGKWILDQLLCRPPEDPPGDVAMTVDPPENEEEMSVKEVLALHASDPVCASCHTSMDGFGVPLENFDALGRWREVDDFGMPVEPEMDLGGGVILEDYQALGAYLKENPAFELCMTKKMVIYALGRDPQVLDPCALEEIRHEFAAAGHTMRGLVHAVVMSDFFRKRHAPKDGEYEYLVGKGAEGAQRGEE